MTPWPHSLLGGIPRSQVLDGAGMGRRIVTVVCGDPQCERRLAMITDEPDGPWLTVWDAGIVSRPVEHGEPLWAVQAGPLAALDTTPSVRCFDHGPGTLDAARLRSAVATFRSRGRKARVAAQMN